MNVFRGPGFAFPLGVRTYIMGIVNVTPDSFSDGGRYNDPNAAIEHALRLEEDGADIIDIGAESTRPGHTPVSAKEELQRLGPVLEGLRGRLGVPISVDTFKPETAKAAIELGAAIINDVAALSMPGMAETAATGGVSVVIMHPGAKSYPGGVAREVRDFLLKAAHRAEAVGIPAEQICLDPGFGFGKDYAQNLELLYNLDEAKPAGYAFLSGVSRKSFIGASTGCREASRRVAGTVAADTVAVLKGTDIVRVHDVKEALQAARLVDAMLCGADRADN